MGPVSPDARISALYSALPRSKLHFSRSIFSASADKSLARLAAEIARLERFFVLIFSHFPLIFAVELGRTPPLLCAGLVRDIAADELAHASFFHGDNEENRSVFS